MSPCEPEASAFEFPSVGASRSGSRAHKQKVCQGPCDSHSWCSFWEPLMATGTGTYHLPYARSRLLLYFSHFPAQLAALRSVKASMQQRSFETFCNSSLKGDGAGWEIFAEAHPRAERSGAPFRVVRLGPLGGGGGESRAITHFARRLAIRGANRG